MEAYDTRPINWQCRNAGLIGRDLSPLELGDTTIGCFPLQILLNPNPTGKVDVFCEYLSPEDFATCSIRKRSLRIEGSLRENPIIGCPFIRPISSTTTEE